MLLVGTVSMVVKGEVFIVEHNVCMHELHQNVHGMSYDLWSF